MLSIDQSAGIRLAGELDMDSAPDLDRALETLVERGGPILVDLTDLGFMDSTGIHSLMKAALSLGGRGCLILHGEQERVRRVLDLVALDASIPNLHRVPEAGSLDGARSDSSKARSTVG